MICCLLVFSQSQAQNTMAKLKYEDAEKDYINHRYTTCIAKIGELENMGFKNPKVLHLKIMSRSCLVIGITRLDYIYMGFHQVKQLRDECNYYLQNYDIEGLEDKYKEVYEISNQLRLLPVNESTWNANVKSMRASEQKEKDRIIQDFLTKMALVKQGAYYRDARCNIYVYRSNGYTDTTGYRPKRDSIDHDYYVSKNLVTDELWWAVMPGTITSVSLSPGYRNKPATENFWTDKNTVMLNKSLQPVYPQRLVSKPYQDILKFIERLNKLTGKQFRLLTAREWEYAVRGGQKQQLLKHSYIIGGKKRKGYKYKYIYTYKDWLPVGKNNELDMVFFTKGSSYYSGISELVIDEDNLPNDMKSATIGQRQLAASKVGNAEIFKTREKEPGKGHYNFRLVIGL